MRFFYLFILMFFLAAPAFAGLEINPVTGKLDKTGTAAAGGGIEDVVEDTTPQLGGDLDVNGKTITSASNGDVLVTPNGSGNVGIATIDPQQKLQVVGTVQATAFIGDGSGLSNVGASGWTDGGTNVYVSTTTDNVAIGTTTPGTARLTVLGGNVGIGTTLTQGALVVMNGNVGIGTWIPTSPLTVMAPSASTYSATATPNARMVVTNNNTTINNFEGLRFQTLDSAGANAVAADIVAINVSHTAGSVSGDLVARTVLTGTMAERMRIMAGGNVGIGTVAPIGKLAIVGDEVRIWTGAGTNTNAVSSGELYVEGDMEVDGTIYTTSIDGGAGVTLIGGLANVGIGTNAAGAAIVIGNSPSNTSATLCIGTDGCIGACTGGLALVCGTCTCLTHP
jgi:hypothetical protein